MPTQLNNIIEKLRQYIKKTGLIYILTGALFTLIIIYLRFIRQRPLGPLDSVYTSLKFWLILCSLILFYLLLIYTMFLPYYLVIIEREYRNQHRTEDRKFLGIFSKIIEYISESQKAFWSPIMDNIIIKFPGTIVPFVSYITKLNPYIYGFTKIIYFLPPLVIASIFFIETAVYQKYVFFPYSIFLMIFPVGWRALLYFLRYFCEQYAEQRSSKTLTQYSSDLLTKNPIYGWSADASKYDITEEELDSPESLLIEIFLKHKYEDHLELFYSWTRNLTLSKYKYYFQIITYSLLFTASWIKLILLH